MTQATYADGSITTYAYNAIGQRTESQLADANGIRTWTYTYDNRDRLSTETKPDGSTLAYQYDAAGNKTQLITTLASGESETIIYAYDALNRLSSVTNSTGTTTYGYDEVGNRSSISHPNGSSQTWQYDTRNRLTRTAIYNSAGVLIQSFDYTLHPTGRRTAITELNGRTSTYAYNDLYWLTQETITDAINGNYSASYQYDTVGNRTQGTEAGITTAYRYDDNDRLLQHGGVYYTYDANGNTLTENDEGVISTYGYNSQNQLIEHSALGITTNYQYNPDSIRHSQRDATASTEYLVDANRDYAQVLSESVNGTNHVRYHFGDDLISQSRGADVHYFHTDGLGSTRVLTNASGNTTDTYAYSAFGEVLNQDGLTDNNNLYTGEQFDEVLDQYYLRARYYDQGVGRFTQMDAWMGLDREPVTFNKYLYANANPISNIDPSGNYSLTSIGAGAAGFGALVAAANSASSNPFRFQGFTGSPNLSGVVSVRDAGVLALLLLSPDSGLWDLVFGKNHGEGNSAERVEDVLEAQVDQLRARDSSISISVPVPPKKKGWTTCIARAQDLGRKSGISMTFGWGWGMSRDFQTAKNAAVRMANGSISAKDTHHAQWRCVDNNGNVRTP